MQTLNFTNNQIISTEELIAWDSSLRGLLGNLLLYNSTLGSSGQGAVLDVYDSTEERFIYDHFITSKGVYYQNQYLLNIGVGVGIFNLSNSPDSIVGGLTISNNSLESKLSLFKYSGGNGLTVLGQPYSNADVVYVGFIPVYNPSEPGICNVSASNQVTIMGGDFSKLRGQNSKIPSKIRFVLSNGSPANNNQIFEVISISNDKSSIIISGNTTVETSLKYFIVGSYDLSISGNLDDKFSYVTIEGKLVCSSTLTDITGKGGFIISALHWIDLGNGNSDFTIVDQRLTSLFNFSLPYDYLPEHIVYENLPSIITAPVDIRGGVSFSGQLVDLYDAASVQTPILADQNGVITVYSANGNVFTITTTPNNSSISSIVLVPASVAGQHFAFKIDDNAYTNLYVNFGTGVGSIHYNGSTPSTFKVVPKGTIMKFFVEHDRTILWENPYYL